MIDINESSLLSWIVNIKKKKNVKCERNGHVKPWNKMKMPWTNQTYMMNIYMNIIQQFSGCQQDEPSASLVTINRIDNVY